MPNFIATYYQKNLTKIGSVRMAAHETLLFLKNYANTQLSLLDKQFTSRIQQIRREGGSPAIAQAMLGISYQQEDGNRQIAWIDALLPLFTKDHRSTASDVKLLNEAGKKSEGHLRDIIAYWSNNNEFRAMIGSGPAKKIDEFSDWDYDSRAVDHSSVSSESARESLSSEDSFSPSKSLEKDHYLEGFDYIAPEYQVLRA